MTPKRIVKVLGMLSFVLNVVLPLLLLTFTVFWWNAGYDSLAGPFFLLATLPIMSVFWGLVFLYFGPKNLREAVLSLFPFFLNVLSFLAEGFTVNWVEGLLGSTTATAVGLLAALLLALVLLLKKSLTGFVSWSVDADDYVILFCVAVILLVSLVSLAWMGARLTVAFSPLGIGFFGAQVTSVFIFFWPRLLFLYQEKKL